jgi:hypothetical protein
MQSLNSAALALIFTLACSACATDSVSPAHDQDEARNQAAVDQLMSVSDNLIVPGVRAGRIFLGMTEQQLYLRMGSPNQTYNTRNGSIPELGYKYPGVIALVNMNNHRVKRIVVEGMQYYTAGGVTVGVDELEAKAKIGGVVWENPPSTARDPVDWRDLCFSSGMWATLSNNGQVREFSMDQAPCR